MNEVKVKGWLVIAIVTIALLLFSSNPYTPKHSIFNEDQNGSSKLRETLEQSDLNLSRILISPFGITGSDLDLIVIIGSERKYTNAEISAYGDFVSSGGNLIIFEDFGHAREISESMGISYFDGVLTEPNPQLYVNNPTQFLVRDLAGAWLDFPTEVYIMVNRAAGISDANGLIQKTTFPILVSLSSVFIDLDDDNVQDRNDLILPSGTPVGLFKQYGDGYLTVISDASIPLNIADRAIVIAQTNYNLPNIWWTSLLIQTMASFSNATGVVFDESHQQFILGSTSGILNLIAGTWVGIFNSSNIVFALILAVIIFAFIYNQDISVRVLRKFRRMRKNNLTLSKLISTPTLAERNLSEQYILYQYLGDSFLQTANIELYNFIQQTNKSTIFLDKFKTKYGKLETKRNFRQSLEIHLYMRDFVDQELRKWL